MSLGIKSWLHYLENTTQALPEVTQPLLTSSQILLAYQKLTALESLQLALPDRLQKSVEILSDALGFTIVVLESYDANQQTLTFQAGTICPLQNTETAPTQPLLPLASQVISNAAASVLNNALDAQTPTSLSIYLPESAVIKTLIQFPLMANQTVVGILNLASAETIAGSEAYCAWGQSIASYLTWVYQSEQVNAQISSVQQQLELAACSINGYFYDWDISTGQILQFAQAPDTPIPASATHQRSLGAWVDQIYPDDQHLFETLIEQDFQGNHQFELEYRVLSEEGEIRFMCDRGTVQRDPQGHPIRVVGNVSDISERKQLQLSSQQQVTQYQTLLSDINVVIFQTDTRGHWTYLNPTWSRLTGFSTQDSLGKPVWDFVHPDDRPGLQEAIQNLIDQTSEDYHHELRYRTHLDEDCWFAVHHQILRADDGKSIGTGGTLINITERKQLEQELLHDALHDGLTHLPNRILFMDRLEQACRSFQRHPDELFAVLFLDLDRFKIINDTLGHLVGDQLLIAVAQRLKACLRPEDTVARLGGDEFTILLPNIDQIDDVTHVCDRILQTFTPPFALNNTDVFISTSIGIALSGDPDHQPDDLIRHADIALYRAKGSGKGCYAVFTPEMPLQPLAPAQIETELHQALEEEELRLYCQPIVALETNDVWGFTFEPYWQHPNRDLLPPHEFLPTITESGLQIALGWWLLKKACRQLHQWQRIPAKQPEAIVVAVTEPQFASSKFVAQFEQTLAKEQIDPKQLILSLPDTLWPRPSGKVLDHARVLYEQGVRFVRTQHDHDYEWLSADPLLPIDWIKLSPTLLGNLEQQGYLESIHSMFILASNAGTRMLADGIQTPKQLILLSALKCDYGQGSHFTDALPAHAADPWLEPSFSQPLDSMPSSTMSLLIIYSPIGQSQVPLVGKRTWTIGRSPDNTIVLPDRWASRNHAQLRATETGEFYLTDLGSGNGSVVNGERVTMPVELKDGDLITIGHSQLEFHHRSSGESALAALETAPKNVLMMQSAHLQGQVWKEALSSQGISLTWLNENIDLAQYLTQSVQSGQGVPDLLLLDMTILKPNPYSFCRWCHNLHPGLKIILTSGTRTFVPASERKWAIHQGASELISAFDEGSIFSNVIDVMAKVRVVLATLNWRPIEQGTLSSALLAIKPNLSTATFSSKQTIIGELPADLDLN